MLSSGLALSRIIMKSRICGWLDVVNYIRLTQAQSNWSLGLAEVQSNWTLPLTEELMLNKSCWGREDCIFFFYRLWPLLSFLCSFEYQSHTWKALTELCGIANKLQKKKNQEFWKDMLEQTWGSLEQHFLGGVWDIFLKYICEIFKNRMF